MIVDESKYSWAAWTQPTFTSNTTWGNLLASSSNAGKEPYFALDGNASTQWEGKSQTFPCDLIWKFEKPLRVRSIELTNKNSSSTYYSKTVNVYAESEKSTLLKSGIFPNAKLGKLTITFDNPICLDEIVLEFADSYNGQTGIAEMILNADLGEKLPEVNSAYLLTDNQNKYYTYDATQGLVELNISELNASVFEINGFQEIPPSDTIKSLVNPTLLYWQRSQDNVPTLQATVKAIPPMQVVYSKNYTLPDGTLGIESISVDASSNTLFAFSFDNGASWKVLSGSTWVNADDSTGMSKTEVEAIPINTWNIVTTQKQYKIRFLLAENGYCKKINIKYLTS